MTDKSIDKVAVIIPNLNGAAYIGKAIDSLLKQDFRNDIIVVENASSDNSMDILHNYANKITIIENERNLGFAGGVNTGIEYALQRGYDAVALFNNDAVASKDWLSELVRSMRKSETIGIATCKIKLADGSGLDSTGEFYTSWGMPYPRGRGKLITQFSNEGFVFGASGGASLYRADLFRSIGMFDDRFFAYYEDTDISFRAQLAGWKVAYNPLSTVTHRQGETSKKMVKGFTVYQTFKNLPMLFWKNVPRELLFKIGLRFFLAYSLIFAKALFGGNAWPALKGYAAWLALIPHTILKRRVIQQNKSVSADYIDSILVHDLPPDQTGIRKFRKIFTRK